MSNPASIDSLKKYSRAAPLEDEDIDVLAEINGQSDRASAITIVTQLEDDLAAALKRWMRADMAAPEDAFLFYGDGPLATFSAKIKIGYALGIYGPKTREDLDVFREVRNACAHSKRPISFEIPVVSNVVKRLHVLGNIDLKRRSERALLGTQHAGVRARFVRAALVTMFRLIAAPGPRSRSTRRPP